MNTWLGKKHPTIESIWDFAKKYPALFLGLCTAVVSFVTVAFNAIQYCYTIGYYHYGKKVIASLIEKPETTGITMDFVACAVLTCFYAIYTLLGKSAYRKRKYLRFLLETTLLLVAFLSLLLVGMPITYGSGLDCIMATIAIFIVAIIATMLLNAITIVNCIFRTDEDRLARVICKLDAVDKKLCKSKKTKKNHNSLCKKRNYWAERKRNIENCVNEKNRADQKELRTAATRYHLRTILAMAIALIVEFAICIPLITFCGYRLAGVDKSYTIVANQQTLCQEFEQMGLGDEEVNALTVLYKYENRVVVAPCHISEKTITVYNQYQRVIDIEGLVFCDYDVP